MKKILVIEDEEIVRIGIKELLVNSGYNVVLASDGKEGIKVAREEVPDLIVCDIMMPGVDGYGVLSALTEDPVYSSIPFIFLTAKADMGDLRKGMELGADDYIMKPFQSKTLISAIEARLLKKERVTESVKLQSQLTQVDKKLSMDDRVFVENSGKLQFLKVSDVKYITSLGNYCKIACRGGITEIARKTLKEWEEILPEGSFIRIHRSVIVNLNYVEKFSKWSSGTYKVYIKDTEDSFVLSQRYATLLRSKLKI